MDIIAFGVIHMDAGGLVIITGNITNFGGRKDVRHRVEQVAKNKKRIKCKQSHANL